MLTKHSSTAVIHNWLEIFLKHGWRKTQAPKGNVLILKTLTLSNTTAFHLANKNNTFEQPQTKKKENRLNPDYLVALGSLWTSEWLPVVSATESKCPICQAAHSSTQLQPPPPLWQKSHAVSKKHLSVNYLPREYSIHFNGTNPIDFSSKIHMLRQVLQEGKKKTHTEIALRTANYLLLGHWSRTDLG